MAKRFGRATNPPIHFPGWDEGETITLHPVKTWLMDTAIQEAALGISVDALQEMETDTRATFIKEHGDSKAFTRALILQMVASHTFTDDDGAPLDMAVLVDQFTSDELRFLRTEIDARDGTARVPDTEAGGFPGATGVPDEGSVPALCAPLHGAPGPGSKGDQDNGLDPSSLALSARRPRAPVSGGVGLAGGSGGRRLQS